MPLPDPTSQVKAAPWEILNWTGDQAPVATDSPLQPVQVDDKRIPIAWCNNAYTFSGIGLGAIAVRANRVTGGMLIAAANTPASYSSIVIRGEGAVSPMPGDIREVGKRIAVVVAKQAQTEGKVLRTSDKVLNDAIKASFQSPRYRAYCRASF